MVIKAEQYGTMIFIILLFLSKITFCTSVLSSPFSCLYTYSPLHMII